MVVVAKVPSPWGEAAKGIFHVKGIDFAAVRLVYDNEALKSLGRTVERPGGYLQRRAAALGLGRDPDAGRAAGADAGAAVRWCLRFADGHCCSRTSSAASMASAGIAACSWCTPGSRKPADSSIGSRAYLGGKYGYDAAAAEQYSARVIELLGEFAGVLRAQRDAGKSYYIGDELSALDIYSATFMALFKPLPPGQCDMHPGVRAAFEWLDAPTAQALDPILLEHRDMMYSRHLQLPLSL